MLDTKMFFLGFLLLALAHQALARVNQVEVGVNIVVVSHSLFARKGEALRRHNQFT